MAKKTIDLQLSRVALMAEGDRLARPGREIGARLGIKDAENNRKTANQKHDKYSNPLPHDECPL